VVSVLVAGPKGITFEPGRGDGFLRAIKILSTPSFGWEVKPENLQHDRGSIPGKGRGFFF
jgi:hypothetical protein